MNVLVYCPLAPKTPKIYGRTLQSIFRLEWDLPLQVVFGREDKPTVSHYRNLADKHNEARRMVLAGPYDALLMVEADMVIPPDALEKLTSVDADVVYGLYVNRHGWRQWLCFTHLDRVGSVSLSANPPMAKAVWGAPIESRGAGMGCTLIHRHVLETLQFRIPPQEDVADDWMFSLDCQDLGYRQVHHTGVVCGHISPQGILWPDPDANRLVSIEMDDLPVRQATPEQPLVVEVKKLGLTELYGVTDGN